MLGTFKGCTYRILQGLNGRAEIIRTEQGQVPSEALLGRQRFDPTATLGAARWIRMINDPKATASGAGVRSLESTASRHEDTYGIRSFVFEARGPLVREKFVAWLEHGLPVGLWRAKGFFWVAEQPADIGFLSVAGGSVRRESIGTWAAALRERSVISDAEIPAGALAKWCEPYGDRRQELVFIGTGLDEAAMRAALTECLA